MQPFTRLARDRLQLLAGTLATLRERVREAVASEMGKAVGDALRDLLTAVLTRSAARPPAPLPTSPSRSRWDDDDEQEWYEKRASVPQVRIVEPARSTPQPLDAARLGLGLTRWLLQLRMPLLAGLGVGLAAGLASLSGHPLVQTGLGLIAAAVELAAITEFTANSP